MKKVELKKKIQRRVNTKGKNVQARKQMAEPFLEPWALTEAEGYADDSYTCLYSCPSLRGKNRNSE